MKRLAIITIGAVLATTFGCEQMREPTHSTHSDINTYLTNSLRDLAIENAILREHTIYPYQFVENSVELNELGQRDLQILAAHYRQNPGNLNVRRGDLPQEFYRARVKTVIDTLVKADVDADRLRISDDLPGGDGMLSEWMVIIVGLANDGVGSELHSSASGSNETGSAR